MALGTVLLAALGMLIALAVRNGHTVPAQQAAVPLPASAADGALRIARTRLAAGEIDLAEYLRISRVIRT